MAVGMAIDVEVGAGVRVGIGVKIWVVGAVGDERCEAELVPLQAERVRSIIHMNPINFVLFIV